MAAQQATRQTHLTLDELTQQLDAHEWSFNTESFHDLFKAMEREQYLFKQASLNGIAGVALYIEAQNIAIDAIEMENYQDGIAYQKDLDEKQITDLKQQLAEVRQQQPS